MTGLLVRAVLVGFVGCACACDDEAACHTNRVLMVVGEQDVPICDATVRRVSPAPPAVLETTATCKAVYEIAVDDDVVIEVTAPGRTTQRATLSPAVATDDRPCRSQACAVVRLRQAL